MQKLTEVCDLALMSLGAVIVAIGAVSFLKTAQRYGYGWDLSPIILISSGVGVFLWGVFFGALAEIIARLSPQQRVYHLKESETAPSRDF